MFRGKATSAGRGASLEQQRSTLRSNIQWCRDVIVFFTAVADAKGLGGHTGGAYDTVPEVMIAYGFMFMAVKVGLPMCCPCFSTKPDTVSRPST